MPLSRCAPAGALVLVILLAGCGSSGSNDSVSVLRSALKSYNAARPADLSATGSVCARALNSLNSVTGFSGGGASELSRATSLARTGFANCERAAPELNYPLMSRALADIAQANVALRRARTASRS